jgi:hypothetical protein
MEICVGEECLHALSVGHAAPDSRTISGSLRFRPE